MNSQKQEKIKNKQQEILSALEKSSDENVMIMLGELKKHGELFYIKTLLDMITGKRSEMLKIALVDFVSDIKTQDAVPIITGYVEENFANKDVTRIITASWQSRLDFSQHLAPYMSILIKGNYQAAFEAFTVIENSLDSLSFDELSDLMAIVKKGIANTNRDKQLLLLEMVSLLDKTRRAAQ